HVQIEDGSSARRPEVQHPDRRLEHAADEIGAPDRGDEDHDLEPRRVEIRVGDGGEADRDRDPQRNDDELPAGEERKVVVKDVQRPKQVAGETAFADAELPERCAEDDVHVPDEGPDDVVRRELAGGDPVHGAAVLPGDRRPDDEIDHRRGDHPEHVEVLGDAVLKLRDDRGSHHRPVEVDERAESSLLRKRCVHGAHCVCAKTSSITSSIGGSSIVRSSTSWSDSRRPATREVSSLGTLSVARSPSRWITSPYPWIVARASCRTTPIVLYAANSFPRLESAPSNRILPWWMTITRLHSAST